MYRSCTASVIDEGNIGVKPEGEEVVEGHGEAEVGSETDGELPEMDQEHMESEGERDQSSQEVDLENQRDESEGKDSASDHIFCNLNLNLVMAQIFILKI
ncbi:hypothetical protein L1987_35893 [Smallanthus sonchifolius]|uniref:Uncharacterized protein n=1 Tax=Smallanthus sonchifolius TaxID=185202 RepID=A0ACB9HCI3_9ASTR|nr:hypothetical protein L1987_35893 [Smallanthus sonchifolius]